MSAGAPLPSSRADLQHEVHQLEREYHERFMNDPAFHAKGTMIGNFLDQLESIHEAGDTQRTGFLIAALMDKTMGERELQRMAWEKGMADAKLQQLYLRTNVKNPYLPEGE